jgi:hypothetical protein
VASSEPCARRGVLSGGLRRATVFRAIAATWKAAEFQGFVDGLWFGRGYTVDEPRRRASCPPILESKDELYQIVADQLIARSSGLTIDDDAILYTSKIMRKLWPCRGRS